jgi:hypothetical protein
MTKFRDYFNYLRFQTGEVVLVENEYKEPGDYIEESLKIQTITHGSNINEWNNNQWYNWVNSPAGNTHVSGFVIDELLVVIFCSDSEVMFCTNAITSGYTDWNSVVRAPGFSITAKRSLPYGTTAMVFGSVFGLVIEWMKKSNTKKLTFTGASEGLKTLYTRILKNKSVMSQLDNMNMRAYQANNLITIENQYGK